MIEQYSQVAIEFLKEIWFQLDSIFGFEGTKTFQFIKPYLLQIKESPIYVLLALAALALIPFGLYKIKNNAREQDRKLEELMEEMEDEEEEYNKDDPRKLRRPEPAQEKNAVISKGDDKTLLENKKDELPSIMQILEKLDEKDKNDELHVDTQKIMGTEEKVFELEPVSSELAEPEINKDLNEFEELDFRNEEIVKEDSIDIDELKKESELIDLDRELSNDDSVANYSEIDDKEQDRAIQELQGEMEATINKLTDQLENDLESTSSIEDLSLEEKSEKPEAETLLENVTEPEPGLVSMEKLDIAEESVDKSKSEPLQPVPERDYSFDSRPSREAETLINRLKYFQENLDMKSHHVDKEDSFPASETTSKNLLGEPRFIEQRSFISKSPKVSPEDNKKYMEVLESFIFLKDQNKH